MKRFISVILSAIIILTSLSVFASAEVVENDVTLKFNSDGKFKILHICDIQDSPYVAKIALDYIERTCDTEKPDLIVLGGDNVAGNYIKGDSIEEADKNMQKSIGSFMSIFEERNIPTALVFGNHDGENIISDERQMEIYNTYDCCVAIDEGEDIYGCGNYNIPIMSSDGKKTAYNLWFFDSNAFCEIPDCEGGKYDYVRDDQIEWYVNKSNELKKANGGKAVPSMAFQHIVPPEIFDVIEEGTLISGGIGEDPHPTLHKSNQLSAIMKQGDVKAMFFGHDHYNDYQVRYNNLDFVATPTAGFRSYGAKNRGIRVIELDESDTSTYNTRIVNFFKTYCTDSTQINRFKLYGSEYDKTTRIFCGIKYFFLALLKGESFIDLCKEVYSIKN